MKNEIDKDLLRANNISIRKQTTALPFLLLAIAAISLGGALLIENDSEAKMPLLLVAVVTGIFGIAKMFNMPTVLLYGEKKEPMNEEELFFDIKAKNSVLEMLRNGEFTKLRAEAKDGSNYPLKVELYSTEKGNVAIYRIYHFIPYTYEALTEYNLYKKVKSNDEN